MEMAPRPKRLRETVPGCCFLSNRRVRLVGHVLNQFRLELAVGLAAVSLLVAGTCTVVPDHGALVGASSPVQCRMPICPIVSAAVKHGTTPER